MLSLLPCFTLVKVVSEYLCNHESVAVVKFYSYNSWKILLFSTENHASNLINCMGVMVLGIRGIKRL